MVRSLLTWRGNASSAARLSSNLVSPSTKTSTLRVRSKRYRSTPSQSSQLISNPDASAGDLLEELESRGLLQQVTSRSLRYHLRTPAKKLDSDQQHLNPEEQGREELFIQRTVYAGVDPSARSLHVGNLLPLMGLLHFARYGHRGLALIGGATGSIGDPSGRSTERSALSHDELNQNVDSITTQLRQFFQKAEEYVARRRGGSWTSVAGSESQGQEERNLGERLTKGGVLDVRLVNNLDWTKGLGVLEFLSEVGRHARVTTMLSRDSVKSRMPSLKDEEGKEDSKEGLSFTEFSYQLLQAYDFSVLHRGDWKCSIQLGGSDQMGNIMAGIDLIRRQRAAASGGSAEGEEVEVEGISGEDGKATKLKTYKDPAFGITMPLLTTSTGAKFGKSAGNAIWISDELLSDYDFYQFFLRSKDDEVERYLKSLTLLPLAEVERIMRSHNDRPYQRFAQRMLAEEVTELVRGKEALERAETVSKVIFGKERLENLTKEKVVDALRNDPKRLILIDSTKEFLGVEVTKFMVTHGMVPSRAEARRMVKAGGVYINNVQVKYVKPPSERPLVKADLTKQGFSVFRLGKTDHKVVVIRS
ncbi:hypothetical protein IE53DRAFT_370992 [Violaceomyces palustris]|uniref:Uncharacterized protein n=1 Tax=Violaceomyces palustris TaxID=1673888 RepID=A0ACD0NQC0_9BASI|nr:hypothetical protein IE53DRAFT_370992 [Violaceomyces palustris]